MLGQNIGEAPDFVEGVIEPCRRDADDVRFAKKSHFTSSGRVLFLKFAGLLLHLFCLPQISFKSGSFSGIGLCTQTPGEKQTDNDENGIWPMF